MAVDQVEANSAPMAKAVFLQTIIALPCAKAIGTAAGIIYTFRGFGETQGSFDPDFREPVIDFFVIHCSESMYKSAFWSILSKNKICPPVYWSGRINYINIY